MKNETSNTEQPCTLHSVSKRLLIEMKKNATMDNGHVSSRVFSTFELQCKLNDHITEYRIRKCMKELKECKYIDKKKFFVDNESNLMCWKWYITNAGFNAC